MPRANLGWLLVMVSSKSGVAHCAELDWRWDSMADWTSGRWSGLLMLLDGDCRIHGDGTMFPSMSNS